jgi:hypothetical protein
MLALPTITLSCLNRLLFRSKKRLNPLMEGNPHVSIAPIKAMGSGSFLWSFRFFSFFASFRQRGESATPG